MKIIENTFEKRVFYFHEFLYFLNTIEKKDSNSLQNIIHYIVDLLILFDQILIPSSHLVVSSNDYEANFKKKFITHPIIRQLIEHKKIITTIWSQCNDAYQHYQASERYILTIGAKENFYFDTMKDSIMDIEIYQRNVAHQSKKAKHYTNNIEQKADLSYVDNKILINFSHEKLLLGDEKKEILDIDFINSAKRAYVNAMADGNGRVYRSLIFELESSKFQFVHCFNPINLPGGVHPILFSYGYFTNFMLKIGFLKPNHLLYSNQSWINWYMQLLNNPLMLELRNVIFQILEFLSSFSLRTHVEIEYILNSMIVSKTNSDYFHVVINEQIFILRNTIFVEYNKHTMRF